MGASSKLSARLKELQAIQRWCLKSESAPRINAMLDLARSEDAIPVLPDQLDRDPWLFNVPNGTLDLRTGKIREHSRHDYITKLCPTEYAPEATCPAWEKFVDGIFDGDDQLVEFNRRLLGYCLSGDVREQILPICWGVGANGKSTLINAVLEVTGSDYAGMVSADLLLASRGDRHPTELADLFGKRLVVASETDQSRRLNEARIKTLTGGDRIKARRMKEDFWEFQPTHKVVLLTNHRPVVRGTDAAIWRRLRLVPFNVRFIDPDEPEGQGGNIPENRLQDKQLPQKLAAEREGILAWMVQGFLDWQRDGLPLPDAVRVATATYRAAEDLLAAWIEECCHVGSREFTRRSGDLYANFKQWAERSGEEDFPKLRKWGEAMSERGFERYTNDGTWYRGIELRQ